MDVVEDAEVNPDAVTRVKRIHIGFLGQVGVVRLQTKRDEPLAGCLLLDCDLFDCGAVGNWSRIPDSDPADFTEADVGVFVVAPLFIEVETGLVVRHASVLGGCLPFEPTNVVPVLSLLVKV